MKEYKTLNIQLDEKSMKEIEKYASDFALTSENVCAMFVEKVLASYRNNKTEFKRMYDNLIVGSNGDIYRKLKYDQQYSYADLHPGGSDYLYVGYQDGGKSSSILVHRAVATCFIDNPNAYPYINHKNGIRNDNRVANLEWCSPQQNTDDMARRHSEKYRTNMKNKRYRMGMSIEDVLPKVKMQKTLYSDLENGVVPKESIGSEQIELLEQYYGAGIDYLLHGADYKVDPLPLSERIKLGHVVKKSINLASMSPDEIRKLYQSAT